jgi:hypothetical protein
LRSLVVLTPRSESRLSRLSSKILISMKREKHRTMQAYVVASIVSQNDTAQRKGVGQNGASGIAV